MRMFSLYTFYSLPRCLVSYDISFCIFFVFGINTGFIASLPLPPPLSVFFSFAFSSSACLSLAPCPSFCLSVCLSAPQEPPAFTAVQTGPCGPAGSCAPDALSLSSCHSVHSLQRLSCSPWGGGVRASAVPASAGSRGD